jgi:hypothetical protein
MGYPRRGNLPGTKEDKLAYELISNAVNDLHKSICRLAVCESVLNPSNIKQRRVEIVLGDLNDVLKDVLDWLEPEQELDAALLDLVGLRSIKGGSHEGHES